jgi:hypothetical protein
VAAQSSVDGDAHGDESSASDSAGAYVPAGVVPGLQSSQVKSGLQGRTSTNGSIRLGAGIAGYAAGLAVAAALVAVGRRCGRSTRHRALLPSSDEADDMAAERRDKAQRAGAARPRQGGDADSMPAVAAAAADDGDGVQLCS